MSKPKLIINQYEMSRIKDCALDAFREEIQMPDNRDDTQIFLILRGLATYLTSKGYEVPYEVPSVRGGTRGDNTPLDDL